MVLSLGFVLLRSSKILASRSPSESEGLLSVVVGKFFGVPSRGDKTL
jgi:hypothetical protein